MRQIFKILTLISMDAFRISVNVRFNSAKCEILTIILYKYTTNTPTLLVFHADQS